MARRRLPPPPLLRPVLSALKVTGRAGSAIAAEMRGEILAVIGRSGTGKSVFLKHLIGLGRSDREQVLVDGEDIRRGGSRNLARIRERFGMLFQGGALFDSLTVEDNVPFPLREKTRMSAAEIRATVTTML
jgi:phospholipid/cholesterol/gamma-HCH transport system ATP-binding protein